MEEESTSEDWLEEETSEELDTEEETLGEMDTTGSGEEVAEPEPIENAEQVSE